MTTLSPGVRARYRLKAPDATPLLVDANGEIAALRKPYLNGTLVVIATPQPLLNQWLRDDTTARFVFRQIVESASTSTLGPPRWHGGLRRGAPLLRSAVGRPRTGHDGPAAVQHARSDGAICMPCCWRLCSCC